MDKKCRYWTFILYGEDILNLEVHGDELIQIPYCYCIHDKDHFTLDGKEEERKTHCHIVLAFNNTTTYKHALDVANEVGIVKHIEPVIDIGYMYKYLIHNTPDAIKKGKHQYQAYERMEQNGFDIGNYIQLNISDKNALRCQIMDIIKRNNILFYSDLVDLILESGDNILIDAFMSNYGFYEKYIKSFGYKLSRMYKVDK